MERFCACAPNATAAASAAMMRANNLMVLLLWLNRILAYTQPAQCRGASLLRSILHSGVQAFAVAIHSNEQRAESVDAELPQRLGIEVVAIDILDRIEHRRLQA